MNTRLYVGTFLGLSVGAWAALLWMRGVPISWDHFWPFGLVSSFLGAVVALFERWLWALPPLQGWFVARPDFRGTWRVVLKSEWTDPKTGQSPAPITCFMAVRQTLTTLSMRLMTPESSSLLVAHKVMLSNDGLYQVAGVYTNKPQVHLRGDRSEIHFGAILLDVHGEPPTELEGHYWTDRHTRGGMRLTDRRRQVCPTFDAARTLFGEG